MHCATSLLCLSAALALAGCNSRDAAAPAAKPEAVAATGSESGGSRKGDFGQIGRAHV